MTVPNEPPIFPPQYRTRPIPACPHCGSDLDDEAFSFWCAGCRQSVSFAEVVIFDDGDLDD